jgi:glycosyltransferase involved in cell wall biosynthesis
MSSLPYISVIMPVFNADKYLKDAIESILNQTYKNFEFLIINDGSTDRSGDIIKSYSDPRIVYIINEQNRGFTYSLNLGLNLAKGEFLARMDADDISDPTRFEKQASILDKNPEIGVCGAFAKFFGIINVKVPLPTTDKAIKTRMLFGNPIIHSSVMMRSALVKEHNIQYDVNNYLTEDYELWMRLGKITKLYNLKEYLIKYRVHDTSVSRTKEELQQCNANKVSIQALEFYLNIIPTETEIDLHKTLLNRTSKQQYDDKLLTAWARKLVSQNKILETLDMLELKKSITDNWFSYLYHHKNNGVSTIAFSVKIARGLRLLENKLVISAGLNRLIKF